MHTTARDFVRTPWDEFYILGNTEHVNFGQKVLASTYPGLLCPWLCDPGAPLLQRPHCQGTEHIPLSDSGAVQSLRLFERDFFSICATYTCMHMQTYTFIQTCVYLCNLCLYLHVCITHGITLLHHSCPPLESFLRL